MTHSASASHLGTEFNNFLFAPIGVARDEMPLSVLSALARLDVDPWQEAAQLARLPVGSAVQRLSSLIGALPDGPSPHPDPETIAARLIALLPRAPRIVVPVHQALPAVGVVLQPWGLLFYLMLFMAFMLGAQFFLTVRQPPQARPHVTVADKAFPKVPLAKSGQ